MTPPAVTDDFQIVVDDLVKTYVLPGGTITAIDHVSFKVREGEFFCIVGPSGCGKTTILRILAGLETKSGGDVSVYYRQGGKPRSAMVFQDQSVFPWMTVENNIGFGLRSQPMPPSTKRDVVRYYLDQVGLTAFATAYPHQLSGGMKQRVSIARAFATDPEILLMDEPFGALDTHTKLTLHAELLGLWEARHQTVVFVTHDLSEAITLADRIIVMTRRPGRIKLVHDVRISRPRDVIKLRETDEYAHEYGRVWHVLGEEFAERA
jgi:NitT/TauT family transport system ATP-binding protein